MKPLLGLHVSTSKFDKKIFEFGTVQIFAGSPQTFQIGQSAVDFVNKYHKDFKIIIHSPYIINLVNSNHNMFPKTFSFTKQIAEVFGDKIYGYNTHLGLIYTKQQLKNKINESTSFGESTLQRAIEKLLPVYEKNKTILLLENAAGNEYGSDLSSVKNITDIVRKFNSPYLKMTLDTCHSFGNGEITIKDIDQLEQLKDVLGAIHFNSIGEGVFGQHKDSHGTCLITECTQYKYEDYKNFYSYIKDIPTILERDFTLGILEFEMLTNI